MGTRLLALLALIACLLSLDLLPPRPVLALGCAGDEQLLVAPLQPQAGDIVLVAAVSKFPHEQALLLGPDGPLAAQREAVGDLFVWQATVVPAHGGEYHFAFGVADSVTKLTACADALTVVADADPAASPPDGAIPVDPAATPGAGPLVASVLFASLHPWAADGSLLVHEGPSAVALGAPDAATGDDATSAEAHAAVDAGGAAADPPHRARSSSRPSNSDNGNDNDTNDNDADPTPTRTPTRTRTPTPTKTPTERPTATETPLPTPTLAPPSISSISPETLVCGQRLTLHGQRFGESRSLVTGKVRIDSADAAVVAWSMSEVEVRVPQAARPGNSRLLEIVVAGQTDNRTVRVSC